jgi:hypothetical protein
MFQVGMLAFYLGFVVLGAWAALQQDPAGPRGGQLMGTGIALVGGLCAALTVASFFLPRRPWAWSLHLMLIVLGIVGAITTPCALFVALAWFRKDTLAWFGQAVGSGGGDGGSGAEGSPDEGASP